MKKPAFKLKAGLKNVNWKIRNIWVKSFLAAELPGGASHSGAVDEDVW